MTKDMIRWVTLTASAFPTVASFSGCHEKQWAQQAAPPEVKVEHVEKMQDLETLNQKLETAWSRL